MRVTSAPEQRLSSPVDADLGEFLEDVKLDTPPRDWNAIDSAKRILEYKHDKSHQLQKREGRR